MATRNDGRTHKKTDEQFVDDLSIGVAMGSLSVFFNSPMFVDVSTHVKKHRFECRG